MGRDTSHYTMSPKALSNLALNTARDGAIHNFLGQPIPVPHHPHSKELLPYIQSKLPLFKIEPITPCPITTVPNEESLPSILLGPLQILGRLL